MSLVISEKTGGNFEPLPAGTYVAVCCMMVDCGTQYNERYEKFSPKVRIGWEVPEETITVDGEQKPRLMSKEYTASLSSKSTLRKDLESWRGRAFTDEELKRFDLKSIVGAPCMINVIHNEYNGKTYAKVSGVMAMPKGMPRPSLSEPATVFEFGVNEISEVNNLPNWLGNIVMKSKEYTDAVGGAVMEELPPEEDLESDLPF